MIGSGFDRRDDAFENLDFPNGQRTSVDGAASSCIEGFWLNGRSDGWLVTDAPGVSPTFVARELLGAVG